MPRLIYVPQYPGKLRYQQWFPNEFLTEFSKRFESVIILGLDILRSELNKSIEYEKQMFSPIKAAIDLENIQVEEFMTLDIREDDTLFLADLSFPGFFSNVLYHKPVKNAFAYCHATSLNAYDYFAPVRDSKFKTETAHSQLFKKVFVGSYYHQRKLGWKNTEVIGLPVPPYKPFKDSEKIYDIISVSRPGIQKVTKRYEKYAEQYFDTKVQRRDVRTWSDYYQFLSQGKVLLITAKEETFGYQVVEALMNRTFVVAPNKFSYPELLSSEFLYNNKYEMIDIIRCCLEGRIERPPYYVLNTIMMQNFYRNLIDCMKGT